MQKKSKGSNDRVEKSSSVNSVEKIKAEAYKIYENRMRSGSAGSMLSDWLEAEKHINSL